MDSASTTDPSAAAVVLNFMNSVDFRGIIGRWQEARLEQDVEGDSAGDGDEFLQQSNSMAASSHHPPRPPVVRQFSKANAAATPPPNFAPDPPLHLPSLRSGTSCASHRWRRAAPAVTRCFFRFYSSGTRAFTKMLHLSRNRKLLALSTLIRKTWMICYFG